MINILQYILTTRHQHECRHQTLLQRLHIDGVLLCGLLLLAGFGLTILFSASGEETQIVLRQVIRVSIAIWIMLLAAQIPPHQYYRWTPWIFAIGLIGLILVLLMGHVGKGAQRWLSLGIVHLQPSELMKLAIPMIIAWYFHRRHLPPKTKDIIITGMLMLIPALLTARQPDLGTAIMLIAAGGFVLILAGIAWQWIITAVIGVSALMPFIWHFMHDYQRQRILTFLNPERDPLGTGYHIIQSKIAIGSGGFFGKGWLHGTQSHLNFLPEHATDFIFAVCGEEFGLLGCLILLMCYFYITGRGLYISLQAQDTYTRLLAGSLSLTFCLSALINIGMVSGILPVVGLPLPLVSYGGTSLVTVFAGFGILMSIHTHRKLLSG